MELSGGGARRQAANLLAAWRAHPGIRIPSPSQALGMQPVVSCTTSRDVSRAVGYRRARGAAQDRPRVHEDGITTPAFNALVDVLRSAMAREGVGLPAQSRLFAKLAPMKRGAVTRWFVPWGSQQWWVTRPIDVSPDQRQESS